MIFVNRLAQKKSFLVIREVIRNIPLVIFESEILGITSYMYLLLFEAIWLACKVTTFTIVHLLAEAFITADCARWTSLYNLRLRCSVLFHDARYWVIKEDDGAFLSDTLLGTPTGLICDRDHIFRNSKISSMHNQDGRDWNLCEYDLSWCINHDYLKVEFLLYMYEVEDTSENVTRGKDN